MKIKTSLLCFLIITGIAMSSCTQKPDCEVGISSSTISVNFYSKVDSSRLFVQFLSVSAVDSDSNFYAFQDSLSIFELQLNLKTDHSTYLFVSGTVTDTLKVGYLREMEWLSEECGPSFRLSDLKLLNSTFTSILASAFIDNSINENIKIYN